MSRKHKVRTHHWIGGVLQTMEHFFDSIDEANTFASTVNAHTTKVYDPDGNLLSTATSTAIPDQVAIPVSTDGYTSDTYA